MKLIVKALVSLLSAKKFNLEQSKVLSISKDLNMTHLSEREITLYNFIRGNKSNKQTCCNFERERGGQKK